MYEQLLRHIVTLNQWRKRHISHDNFLIIAAAIVGVFGGLAAALLKSLTHFVAAFMQNDFHWQYKYYLYFFFPLIGLFLTVLYIKTFIRKHDFRHGIPPLIKSISKENSRLDFHNIYSQIISSALTVGLGGSAGLEAPAVASGSAIGSNVGRLFGLNYRETTLLLACGGAAGIAGAFNSPVAGMIFAIEVLLPSFSIPAFIPLLIASAVASVVSQMLNSEPLFAYVAHNWIVDAFWFYIVFGVIAGFYSVYFSRLNTYLHKVFDKINGAYRKALVGGIALGVMIAVFPAVYGEGYISIQKLLDGRYESLLTNSFFSGYQHITWVLIAFAALSLMAKTVACVVTMSSGGNGGMFGPSVVVGGLLGFVFAFGLNQTGFVHLNVTHFIVAGMAASVAGVMHAPLTGVFLSAEITGGYVLIVPLMVVSAISYFINKGTLRYSIYTKRLAEQDIVVAENKDASVLTQMKLKYLLEKDFVVLHPEDTVTSREKDIIHSEKSLFPVVGQDGKLLGLLGIETLLEHLVSHQPEMRQQTIAQLVQPVNDAVCINAKMRAVMQLMDKKNVRILPVVDEEEQYLGFITKTGIFNRYRKLLVRQNDILY
ncbi:MAG TPA: chloride channel protein [Edaphocola sp.]|nr:chloride channel protein [Edaphocola sp.]